MYLAVLKYFIWFIFSSVTHTYSYYTNHKKNILSLCICLIFRKYTKGGPLELNFINKTLGF